MKGVKKMAIRNFYISGTIDGRKTTVGAGPANRDGGMALTVQQRSGGGLVTAMTIECYANNMGQLRTIVRDADGIIIGNIATKK